MKLKVTRTFFDRKKGVTIKAGSTIEASNARAKELMEKQVAEKEVEKEKEMDENEGENI